MPIAKLYVEGNLESEVLNSILKGSPVLQRGGSKNSLKPRARAERLDNQVAAGYLRDRDFDFDPPSDLTTPTVDAEDGNTPMGWRWCRHELENYLIEPLLVSAAMEWPVNEIEDAIRQAAQKIRSYQAARWTVGIVRRTLPPQYELRTRPDGLNEIALPVELDSLAVNGWATDSIKAHRERIIAETNPQQIQETLNGFLVCFDEDFVSDVSKVLLWFSGKDILAGMADWLSAKSVANAGLFRSSLRDWIIANPDHTLDLLPEWKSLTSVLRA